MAEVNFNNNNGIYVSLENTFTNVLRNTKANKPNLVLTKLNETYCKVGIELNCRKLNEHGFVFCLNMCDDRPKYRVHLNGLECVERVEFIGFVTNIEEL